MYAIVNDRGHQYKAREGEVLRVDRLQVDKGAKVTFEHVLLVGKDGAVKVGNPSVAGARVTGVLEDHVKGAKTISRRRIWTNKHVVRHGHRRQFSLVKIEKIEG